MALEWRKWGERWEVKRNAPVGEGGISNISSALCTVENCWRACGKTSKQPEFSTSALRFPQFWRMISAMLYRAECKDVSNLDGVVRGWVRRVASPQRLLGGGNYPQCKSFWRGPEAGKINGFCFKIFVFFFAAPGRCGCEDFFSDTCRILQIGTAFLFLWVFLREKPLRRVVAQGLF
ncbi:MAG TPA: hypothetical protein PKD78_08300 [Saprospiraceae bacterium]|nr:hypothetical protein [Saprospiraceae bacterium]